jgi:hypothetical protein
MRDLDRSRAALARADSATDEIERTLWLAKGADHALNGRPVLVGGAAVNLYTGLYQPTDVDMCARLDNEDRLALVQVGFDGLRGDHFRYTFTDGQAWLLEFPEAVVDGDVGEIELDSEERVRVITLESLIVDRVTQATDGGGVTLDEAVRLCVAVYDDADWKKVEADIRVRDQLRPRLGLDATYRRVIARVIQIGEGPNET